RLSGFHRQARLQPFDRAGDVPLLDQPLELGPRAIGQPRGEKTAQAAPAVFDGAFDVPLVRAVLAHAAARCAAACRVGSGRRLSTTSITMESGTRMIDTNCEVDTRSNTMPRLSPR